MELRYNPCPNCKDQSPHPMCTRNGCDGTLHQRSRRLGVITRRCDACGAGYFDEYERGSDETFRSDKRREGRRRRMRRLAEELSVPGAVPAESISGGG